MRFRSSELNLFCHRRALPPLAIPPIYLLLRSALFILFWCCLGPLSLVLEQTKLTSPSSISESCNAAQTRYLRNGLDEMVLLARHAHDRILSLGEEDELYR